MSTSFRFAFFLLLVSGLASAQTQVSGPRTDVAVTFTAQRSLRASTTQNFWMEGGSVEAGYAVRNNFGVALDYTGTHTSSVGSGGAPLTLSVIAAGPRYRWHADRRFSIYGETLFGFAHGSDGVFPQTSGAAASASSFAFQAGGALDYKINRRFALRLIELDYQHTSLPNGSNNAQNTLALEAGIVARF